MASFTAILSAPTGAVLSTSYQGRSGAVYVPASNGQLVITDERDYIALVAEGWSVVSVSRS
jgi:hypothetical protein